MEVIITKAAYGVIQDNTGMKGFIVTNKVKVGQKFGNKQAGKDPFPGKKKHLYVEATVDGIAITAFFPENAVVIFK